MKRIAVVCAVIAVAGLFSMTAMADRTSSAVGKVLVIVDPNVKVDIAADPSPVNHQAGDVSVTLTFRVDANQQMVSLFVEASDLFKGDDPGSSVAPIPLNVTKEAVIAPEHANPINLGDNKAAWSGTGAPVGAFSTQKTETITFESSQNNHFSQDVDVTVTWNQNDPEKPQGQYGGRVRLTAVLQ